MSVKGKIIDVAFGGRKNIWSNLIVKVLTGAPGAALGTRVGLLCYNSFDDDCYICTVKATTWVKINA